MVDKLNAFVDEKLRLEPKGNGELTGYSFAVKDVFSIKGYTNTAGNPDWHKTHIPSSKNAIVIDQLLVEGAVMTGTTHTDEIMYSLNGENHFYGTPVNPKAPDLIPGGSSSGSASAAAGDLVDFALGTDTGGSVRIPSAYCGLYGIRPTHGLVDIEGVIPLAESFDTVGWMSNDPELLMKVGDVLLEGKAADVKEEFKRVYFAEDAWELLEEEVHQVLRGYIPLVENTISKSESINISDEGLDKWAETFRIIQGLEIWQAHGEWIEKESPEFGPGIAERFAWTSTLREEEHEDRFLLREQITERLEALLDDHGLLIIPTASGPAPHRNLTTAELEDRRTRTMQLSCIAGLAGLPQVTIPIATIKGQPLGLSIIAGKNQDKRLLSLAASLKTGLSLSQPY
ncbi:amidase [Sediminibacillus massiliensis]|uniref:amidase n=1 Tax=Sediminibacillus massiliensis TaxID=1926277 RepID=UPI00098854D3|nr:amidase [Sediminibacillus massiliensis]